MGFLETSERPKISAAPVWVHHHLIHVLQWQIQVHPSNGGVLKRPTKVPSLELATPDKRTCKVVEEHHLYFLFLYLWIGALTAVVIEGLVFAHGSNWPCDALPLLVFCSQTNLAEETQGTLYLFLCFTEVVQVTTKS